LPRGRPPREVGARLEDPRHLRGDAADPAPHHRAPHARAHLRAAPLSGRVSAEPRRIDLSRSGRLSLPAWFHESERAEAAILLMAALGVSAKFYRPLAESLKSAGFHVLLLEQRGHGESPVRPSRRASWGFREPLACEIRAAIDWVREHDGALPVYLLGHSLGGHYASMSVGLDPDG